MTSGSRAPPVLSRGPCPRGLGPEEGLAPRAAPWGGGPLREGGLRRASDLASLAAFFAALAARWLASSSAARRRRSSNHARCCSTSAFTSPTAYRVSLAGLARTRRTRSRPGPSSAMRSAFADTSNIVASSIRRAVGSWIIAGALSSVAGVTLGSFVLMVFATVIQRVMRLRARLLRTWWPDAHRSVAWLLPTLSAPQEGAQPRWARLFGRRALYQDVEVHGYRLPSLCDLRRSKRRPRLFDLARGVHHGRRADHSRGE